MKVCRKGLHSYSQELKSCPYCYKIQKKQYNALNQERLKFKKKDYYEANREHLKEQMRSYHKSRIVISNAKSKDKYSSNIEYKLCKNLRNRLNIAIKNNQKNGSAVSDLGCSIDELKKHLESLFEPGMTWENWSINGWHIDHKIALCYFDLSDREQFLEACNYKNLQPIWAKDHYKKSAKERGGAKSH